VGYPAGGRRLLAAMGYWRPLPDFNATVARHMLRLLSVKQDFPVLGYLPVCAMMRKWSLGQMAPGTVRYSRIESRPATADGIDGTSEILVHLQLTAATIYELQTLIQATKEEDEGLSSTLREALRLNYRQRDILSRALKCPDAEFTLREHRLAHRTAYSTARADLLELAEMGLLLKGTRRQAFVFSPAPDLRSRLGHELVEAE
jgi:Fic family protein